MHVTGILLTRLTKKNTWVIPYHVIRARAIYNPYGNSRIYITELAFFQNLG